MGRNDLMALSDASGWEESSAECAPLLGQGVIERVCDIIQDRLKPGQHPPLCHGRQSAQSLPHNITNPPAQFF